MNIGSGMLVPWTDSYVASYTPTGMQGPCNHSELGEFPGKANGGEDRGDKGSIWRSGYLC